MLRFSPSGDEREVLAADIPGPVGLFIDGDDRVYVTSCKSGSIYTIGPEGDVERLVQHTLLQCPIGITQGDDGALYVCNFNDGLLVRIELNGALTALATLPGGNNGHITSRHGALWVAAMTAHQLYRVDLDGTLTRIAGNGKPGGDDGASLEATLYKPNAMAFDPTGTTLYWNDQRGYRADAESAKASVVRKLALSESATSEKR